MGGGPSLMAQTVKNLLAMWETQVWPLGHEETLEKGMATHSRILAWRIPWTEESGRLQSVGSRRVEHDWATNTFTTLLIPWDFELQTTRSTLGSCFNPLSDLLASSCCFFLSSLELTLRLWVLGIGQRLEGNLCTDFGSFPKELPPSILSSLADSNSVSLT